MMQAIQVVSPAVGSSFISSPIIQNDKGSKRVSLTVCQLDGSKSRASSSESSRRSLMIATMVSLSGATAAGFITQPDSAEAAKRKPPPPPEEKPAEDEKYLSAYDAKVLASIRRKEALKAQIETQKAKAKIIRQREEPPQDIFGEAPAAESPASETSQLE
ncbi:unnamed protein product [Calypogeia fissa]